MNSPRLILFLLSLIPASLFATEAVILEPEAEVVVVRNSERLEAGKNFPLSIGDQMIVSRGGNCLFQINDIHFKLGASGLIRLQEEQQQTVLRLIRGELRCCDLSEEPGRMKISTSEANVKALGNSDFVVDRKQPGQLRVNSLGGRVAVEERASRRRTVVPHRQRGVFPNRNGEKSGRLGFQAIRELRTRLYIPSVSEQLATLDKTMDERVRRAELEEEPEEKSEEKQEPKIRAVFDYRNSADEGEEPEEAHQPKNNSRKNSNNNEIVEVEVKGGKIVEGQASGQGRYMWDFGAPIWLLLVIIVTIVVIGYIVSKLTSGRGGSFKSIGVKPQDMDEDDYMTDDIHVIRGNYTSNHGLLKTEKVTHILGNVEDQAQIEAAHKLVIKGTFQGAVLHSKESVSVKGGINGQGKGILIIDGDLRAAYISEVTVFCTGDIEVDSTIMNSNIACGGAVKVTRKAIMGGCVGALKGVETPVLGSDFSATKIVLGESPERVWVENLKLEADGFNVPEVFPETDRKAKLRVFEEFFSALVIQGEASLDQKTHLPGPVETHKEYSSPEKLQLRGFRLEDKEKT